jgi:hypothetical protein
MTAAGFMKLVTINIENSIAIVYRNPLFRYELPDELLFSAHPEIVPYMVL